MYHHLLLHFIQRFSYLQQYIILSSLSLILLLVFNYWWCIVLLPFSTFLVHFAIKRLSRSNRSPSKLSGDFYNYLLRKRPVAPTETSIRAFETALEEEYNKYIKTIIARYVCAWYYPAVSTNQDFLDQLSKLFTTVIHDFTARLKLIDIHELIRLAIDLKQKHMEQYLRALDSFRKQRKQTRINKSVVEEFSQINGLHSTLVKNDIHAYLRVLVELLITQYLPKGFPLYSSVHPVRELLTQILVNVIFLPLFLDITKPRTIYHLLVILLETEEQKKIFEANENSLIAPPEMIDNQNEREESVELTDEQSNQNTASRRAPLEQIIYSATLIAIDTAYNSMSGAAYTVYIIQCETKSPFGSNDTQRYTIRRRFREFTSLHKRLQQNNITSQQCYDIDEVYRALPLGMNNMNPDIIYRRRCTLEKYIQSFPMKFLNCSHDVLEFFAFNSDPNIQFEDSPPSKLPVPRVDKVLFRTLSGVGNKLTNFLPAKREMTPLRETFQLNVAAICESTSPVMERLAKFSTKASTELQERADPVTLNSVDQEFLQFLVTRPSIVSSRRKEKQQSEIPLTDAVLNLVYTALHSRDAIVSNESIHIILRTMLGHLIEEFLKTEIDDIFSPEKIITYLTDLRTKVLWPSEDNPSKPMKNIKHRAYNAIIHLIPMWLQYIVGVENIHRIVVNLLECVSHEQLNRHLLFNALDSLIVQFIPDIGTEPFLTKYVHMHTGSRS